MKLKMVILSDFCAHFIVVSRNVYSISQGGILTAPLSQGCCLNVSSSSANTFSEEHEKKQHSSVLETRLGFFLVQVMGASVQF